MCDTLTETQDSKTSLYASDRKSLLVNTNAAKCPSYLRVRVLLFVILLTLQCSLVVYLTLPYICFFHEHLFFSSHHHIRTHLVANNSHQRALFTTLPVQTSTKIVCAVNTLKHEDTELPLIAKKTES